MKTVLLEIPEPRFVKGDVVLFLGTDEPERWNPEDAVRARFYMHVIGVNNVGGRWGLDSDGCPYVSRDETQYVYTYQEGSTYPDGSPVRPGRIGTMGLKFERGTKVSWDKSITDPDTEANIRERELAWEKREKT